MPKMLEGKTCVVTGSARGMGKALAIRYAENGANVVMLDLNKDGVEAAAKDIEALGVEVLAIAVDIGSSKDVDRVINEIEAKFNKIDVLANCAGICISRKMLDVDEAEWDKIMNVNLKSIYFLSRRTAQNMIKNSVRNGKIVSISSQASKLGEYGNGVYSVSKAGVNMLAQVLGQELAEYGISVNAICPGYVDTEMLREVIDDRSTTSSITRAEFKKSLTDTIPMGRVAEPWEIADLLLFLSSEKANYITCQSITIAGGKTTI